MAAVKEVAMSAGSPGYSKRNILQPAKLIENHKEAHTSAPPPQYVFFRAPVFSWFAREPNGNQPLYCFLFFVFFWWGANPPFEAAAFSFSLDHPTHTLKKDIYIYIYVLFIAFGRSDLYPKARPRHISAQGRSVKLRSLASKRQRLVTGDMRTRKNFQPF